MEHLTKMIHHAGTSVMKAPKGSDRKDKEVQLYQIKITKPKDAWFGYELPEKYDKILEEAVFAIPRKALDTIQYLLIEGEAQSYFPMYRGYDTNIREHLQGIGEEFIKRAFYLICDYHFDKDNFYYARGSHRLSRFTLTSLMIYKFYSGRGGCGLQWFRSGFNKVKKDRVFGGENEDYLVAMEVLNHERIQDQDKEIGRKYVGKDVFFKDADEAKNGVEAECIKPSKEERLKLYKIKVCHEGRYIDYKDGEDEQGKYIEGYVAGASGGVVSYSVMAINEERAFIIAKNRFLHDYVEESMYREPVFISQVINVGEINTGGKISLMEEGILEVFE